MRHGEFIVSEVKDFYIPNLNLKYSELLKSVKAKTVSVYKSNPIEHELDYVAVKDIGSSFLEITKRLYGKNINISDGRLESIEQFRNNLEEFNNLSELKGMNKTGKWFVMTKQLKTHYLSHLYQSGETISLSYITGSELASQRAEKIFSKTDSVYTGEKGIVHPLGNINKNSQIEFSIYLNRERGKKLIQEHKKFSFRPPSCRNCTGTNWSVWAEYSVNSFIQYYRDSEVENLDEANSIVKVLINNTVLNLAELEKENLLRREFKEDQTGSYIHYSLHGLEKLDAFVVGAENIVQLKLSPLSKGEAAEGVQITKIGGHKVNIPEQAGYITYQMARDNRTKLAETGLHFDHWNRLVGWDTKDPQGFTPQLGKIQKYWRGIVVDIIGTINNNYN